MKNQSLFFSLFFSLILSANAQDTFSIIAVDPATGEVGSAGASCIDTYDCNGCGGVIIINNLLPGRGGMNSQATVCIPNSNLNNGLNQMNAGLSPQEVLDWLQANDACGFGNVNTRQYGIADFDPEGNPRAAGYTGANCLDYANHNTGESYSIQGNILLGQQILDSMEQRFLNTEGPLAKRLMAALQGANVPGADTRCLSAGISSKSAFIRVAKPDDVNGNFFLEINVPSVLPGVDPIDSLQTLFDEWYTTTLGAPSGLAPKVEFRVYPNPAGSELYIEPAQQTGEGFHARLFDMTGRQVIESTVAGPKTSLLLPTDLQTGIYLLEIRNREGQVVFTDKITH